MSGRLRWACWRNWQTIIVTRRSCSLPGTGSARVRAGTRQTAARAASQRTERFAWKIDLLMVSEPSYCSSFRATGTLKGRRLTFQGIAVGQLDLFLQRLRRRLRAGVRIKTEQVPDLAVYSLLAHVPLVPLVLAQGEERTDDGFVAVLISLHRPDLVQH